MREEQRKHKFMKDECRVSVHSEEGKRMYMGGVGEARCRTVSGLQKTRKISKDEEMRNKARAGRWNASRRYSRTVNKKILMKISASSMLLSVHTYRYFSISAIYRDF